MVCNRISFHQCVLYVLNYVFVQMHIVTKRKDLTLDQAIDTPNGLAVLGFFIEVISTCSHSSQSFFMWIFVNIGKRNVTHGISFFQQFG